MSKKIRYSDISKKLIALDLLVPQNNEQEYCEKNRIFFSRNPNGSRVFCSYGLSSDFKNVKIELNVHSGAGKDPRNKEGAHHLLEHLMFDKGLRDLLIANNVASNASTSEDKVQFYIEGLNSLNYKNYGVPAVIDSCYNQFVNPSGINNKSFLFYEKKVIEKEIDEYNSNFYRVCEKHFDEFIFNEGSFVRQNILGTYKTLDSIKSADLHKLILKYFNANNVSLLIKGEGKKQEMYYLFNILNKKAKKLDNQGLNTIEVYVKDPKIKNFEAFNYLETKNELVKNNLCRVGFVSKFNEEIFSAKEFAFFALKMYLDKIYIEKIRDKGLVYSGYVDSYSFYTGEQILFTSGFVSSKIADDIAEKMVKEFNTLLKNLLKTKRLDLFYNEFKLSIMATPLSFNSKITDFYLYYRLFDLLPNSFNLRKKRYDFTIKDLYEVAYKLLETKKVLYKIGDF